MNEAANQTPTFPDLAGKVALVTGGSRGIGATTAKIFATNGVRVGVNGRDEGAIAETVRAIQNSGGKAVGCPGDCTDPSALERVVRSIENAFGPVDVLAAFAGAGAPTPTEQLTLEQWKDTVDTNHTATFLTIKSVLPSMIERKRGAIVTLSSRAGRLRRLASSAFAAAKGGIVLLS
jgi:3-oxoacyl-[acyl-carrier protein] reductase